MAGYFSPAVRKAGVPWHFSDTSANHLQYTYDRAQLCDAYGVCPDAYLLYKEAVHASSLLTGTRSDCHARKGDVQLTANSGDKRRSGGVPSIYNVRTWKTGCQRVGIGVFLASIRFQT